MSVSANKLQCAVGGLVGVQMLEQLLGIGNSFPFQLILADVVVLEAM